MIYKGYSIVSERGYYAVYNGNKIVCTADSMQEAREEVDNEQENKAVSETA